MGIAWAAYQKNPFEAFGDGLNETEFAKAMEVAAENGYILMAEDDNAAFKERGPVAIISVQGDGWRVEPHVVFFKWATPRNKLRVCVAFFQWIRWQKSVGVCIVLALKPSIALFHRCRKYGVLFFCGKIVNGDSRGDQYIFSIKGQREIEHGR